MVSEIDKVVSSYYERNRQTMLGRQKVYKAENKYKIAKWHKEHSLKVKTEVMTYYGNGRCACVKCGFDDIRALTIDHIDGGGNKHRQSISNNGGNNFYKWLLKNNLPEGYQTMCINCNVIKHQLGIGILENE